MRWEVSQKRLLSSGFSENCGGATSRRVLEGLASLAPQTFHLRQVKATVEYVEGQDEVSAKPAMLERKDIQSTKPALV